MSNIAATSDSHARSKKLVKLQRATLKKKQQALVHLHGDEAAGNRLAGLFAKKHRKEFSCTWMIQSKNPQLLLLSYQQLAHRLEIQFDPMDPLEWLLGIVHKSIDRLPSPPLLIFMGPNKIPPLPDRGVVLFVSQNKLDLSRFEEESFTLVPTLEDGDAEALEPSTLVSTIEINSSKKERTPSSLKTPEALIESARALNPEKSLDDWVAFSYLQPNLYSNVKKIASKDPFVIMKLGQYESIAGRFKEADTILRRALEQCKKQIPNPPHQLLESRPEVAHYLLAIATNLSRAGKNKETFRITEEAIRIYSSIYNRDHPFLADCRFLYGRTIYEHEKSVDPKMGEVQLKTHQKDEGFSLEIADEETRQYKHLKICIDQLNEAHRLFVHFKREEEFGFVKCLMYLGKAHHAMTQFLKAERFLMQATQMLRTLNAPLSEIAQSAEELGKTKFELKKYKEAIALFKENVEFQKRLFPNSERVVRALNPLILALIQDKQNQEVIKYFQEGLQLKKRFGYTPTLKENVFYHLGNPIVKIIEYMKLFS